MDKTEKTSTFDNLPQAVATLCNLNLRICQHRKFFNIKPQLAMEILRDEAMVLDDAEITLYENNQPIVPKPGKPDLPTKPTSLSHRPRFKFSMVNIPIGSKA